MGFENKIIKNLLHGLWIRNQIFKIGRLKKLLRGSEEIDYLREQIDEEDRQENYIKNRINEGRSIIAMLNGLLWSRQITRKNKLQTILFNMELKNENVTKIHNRNFFRWKWTF